MAFSLPAVPRQQPMQFDLAPARRLAHWTSLVLSSLVARWHTVVVGTAVVGSTVVVGAGVVDDVWVVLVVTVVPCPTVSPYQASRSTECLVQQRCLLLVADATWTRGCIVPSTALVPP
eukprot:587989-Rhodomonas_salina.5